MIQNSCALQLLNTWRPLSTLLVLSGFSVFTASLTMEENREINSPKNLKRELSSIQEGEVSNPQDKTNDLSIDNGMDVEGEEKPFLPIEILSKVLSYAEQFTLIRADEVCHFFKKEGDRIWENRVLALSHKLEAPHITGLSRSKTFAALEGGRYKNVSLNGCFLGYMCELSSLKNCTTLNLSYNYITRIHTIFSSGFFKHLQELNLSNNDLSVLDNFFNDYSTPALKRLNLSYNYLSQETVDHLKETYKHLETLILEPQIKAPRLHGLPLGIWFEEGRMYRHYEGGVKDNRGNFRGSRLNYL